MATSKRNTGRMRRGFRLLAQVLPVLVLWTHPDQLRADCSEPRCKLCVDQNETVDNLKVDCVQVLPGVELKVQGRLTLSGPGPSEIDGYLTLDGSSSKLRITDNQHTITGDGSVRGRDVSAEIEIASGKTLVNDLLIQGCMVIDALEGTFQNGVSATDDDGKVLANGSCTLNLIGSNIVDYANSGSVSSTVFRWAVDGACSVLQFNQDLICDSTELHGHFYVHAGIVRIGTDPVGYEDIDIETNGDLLHDGGTIIVGFADSISFNVATCP